MAQKPVSRTIAVPGFDEVRDNYPLAARERLGRLLGPDFRPAEGGQLILWHGAPGTGKTYALRALGWEWRSWCELHYVIDPEVFFGQRADYMLDVVLGQDSQFHFEDEERLHPAVARPGRCAARLEFVAIPGRGGGRLARRARSRGQGCRFSAAREPLRARRGI